MTRVWLLAGRVDLIAAERHLLAKPWRVERTSAKTLISGLATHVAELPHHAHRYTPGDLVVWDNWAMLHSATAPPEGPRLLLRADVHSWTAY